jgi:hypothetical protein
MGGCIRYVLAQLSTVLSALGAAWHCLEITGYRQAGTSQFRKSWVHAGTTWHSFERNGYTPAQLGTVLSVLGTCWHHLALF